VENNGTDAWLAIRGRLVGAPISWGICEVPGWGMQLPVDRVLREMRELGLRETELGAIGWLPTDPVELSDVLAAHDLRVVGGFVPLVCHRPELRDETLAEATRMAALLQSIGADAFVTAVVSDPANWQRPPLAAPQWQHLVAMLDEIDDIVSAHELRQVVHPHLNTLIETADEVERFLDESPVPFCLDTGHLTLGGSDPLELAERATERVGLVHLKDVRSAIAAQLRAGDVDLLAAVQAGLFAALGDGDVPIADVVLSLERNGYQGRYVLEQDVAIITGEPPVGEGPVRDVAKSVAYLRSVGPDADTALHTAGGSALTGAPTNQNSNRGIH
jgi:inosose dehydratase